MIVTKYVCDRCGKEIKRNKIYKATVQEGLDEGIHNGVYESIHLCESCTKILLKWIKDNE